MEEVALEAGAGRAQQAAAKSTAVIRWRRHRPRTRRADARRWHGAHRGSLKMILLHVVCERASSRVSLFPERFDRVESGVRRSRSCTRVIIYEYDVTVRYVAYSITERRGVLRYARSLPLSRI